MAKVGKNSPPGGNCHLKPLPQDFVNKVAQHHKKVQVKNVWLENIGFEEVKGAAQALRGKDISINNLGSKGSSITVIALNILFPGNLLGKMVEIQNMPERCFEEKIAKEHAFRNVLLRKFDMRQVITDSNNGIRAVICGLNQELDANSEEITAIILRGDIVEFVMKHPECIEGGNDPDILKSYCFEMAQCDVTVGMNEIRIMSDILESPIHIYRYDDTHIGSDDKILANESSVFGKNYDWKKPIYIYYDPVRSQYMPLHLKSPTKFGILNNN